MEERNKILEILEYGIKETKKLKKNQLDEEERVQQEVNSISYWLVGRFKDMYNQDENKKEKKTHYILVSKVKSDWPIMQAVNLIIIEKRLKLMPFQISEACLIYEEEDIIINAMKYLVKLSEKSDFLTIEATSDKRKFKIKINWED